MLASALDSLITYNPWVLPPTTLLADVVILVRETGLQHWPVLNEDGQLLGTFDVLALGNAVASDPSGATPIAPFVDRSVAAVPLHGCPWEALEQMLAARRGMLPVSEGERIVGTLSTCDFLRELSYGGRVAQESVLDHLQRRPETIDAEATLREAQALLAAGERTLAVLQGDFPLGAFTRTTAARACLAHLTAAPDSPTLGQLLQSCPTLPPGRTIGEAAALMLEHSLDALAISNQAAHLMGVITEEALLRALLQHH